jgi:hypothetical protein
MPVAVASQSAVDRPSAEVVHGIVVDRAAAGWILTFLPYGTAPPSSC